MAATLLAAAHACVIRAVEAGHRGRTVDPAAFDQLAVDLDLSLPTWFRQLFTTVPLCGLSLGWQEHPPAADSDGIGVVEWADADGIRGESLDCYPGLAIRAAGYVNVGGCPFGSGDPFFVNVGDGDDPPLYRVYHDVSDRAELIVDKGRKLVAPTLSRFFATARVDPHDH